MSGRYGPFYQCPDCRRKTAYESTTSSGFRSLYCKWCDWRAHTNLSAEGYFAATSEERARAEIGG